MAGVAFFVEPWRTDSPHGSGRAIQISPLFRPQSSDATIGPMRLITRPVANVPRFLVRIAMLASATVVVALVMLVVNDAIWPQFSD